MLVLLKKKRKISIFSCDEQLYSLSFNSACVSVCPTKSPTPKKHPPKNKCVHMHAHSQLQSHTDSPKTRLNTTLPVMVKNFHYTYRFLQVINLTKNSDSQIPRTGYEPNQNTNLLSSMTSHTSYCTTR